MISTEHASLLIKYYNAVDLDASQRHRLACAYWGATADERREIARAYAKLFSDGSFIQQLMACRDEQVGSPTAATTTSSPAGTATNNRHSGDSALDVGSPAASPTSPPRMTHTQLLLRTAIQDQFPKLVGSGPFTITFGLAQTEADRKEVIDLYASQFERPDPAELQRLVSLPQASSRTRRRISGNYSFFIRCLTTGEMVCAVTVSAHHHQTHHFVEMPLFATAAGYKKNGFGRLLNAALASWCVQADFEFVMISADVQAIPFWQHLGYVVMSKSERSRIAFYYDHECYTFSGAEPMIGYCFRTSLAAHNGRGSPPPHQQPTSPSCVGDGVGDGGEAPAQQHASAAVVVQAMRRSAPQPLCEQVVGDILRNMPRVVVVGPLELPEAQ